MCGASEACLTTWCPGIQQLLLLSLSTFPQFHLPLRADLGSVSTTSRLSLQLEALMRISRRARDSGKLLPLLPWLGVPSMDDLGKYIFG